jgi:hypothetical protein
MRSSNKTRTIHALLAASALAIAQPAVADTIQLNSFWAGAGSASITFAAGGINYHDGSTSAGFTESGGAGGFKTYNLTVDPGSLAPFQSWCVDIFHNFSFAANGTDILNTAASIFGDAKANDLGRLYTNHHNLVDSTSSTGTNEAAFQLAVWEVVNEKAGNAYDLGSGWLMASGTGAAVAQGWLNELNNTPSASMYNVNIWSVVQGPSGWGPQDVAVFTPIPEPQTYLLLLAGLALVGFGVRQPRLQHAA